MKKILAILLAAALLLSTAACGAKEPAAEAPTTAATEPVNTGADLAAVYENCKAVLPDMFVMDESTMLNFLGIDAADCTQAIVAVSGDGLRADEVWLIEAKDEDALARILDLADVRRTAKEDETISYAPEQYQIVLKGELLTSGLYLAYLVSPDVDTLKMEFLNALPPLVG